MPLILQSFAQKRRGTGDGTLQGLDGLSRSDGSGSA
jgi:hypothetical protein